MELILKQDVDNLGFTDDVVTVKNGYGRNYLIPHGHAALATPSAIKALKEKLKQQSYKERKIIEDAQKEAKKLTDILELKITAKTGDKDKLFGSITNANLADALEKEGVSIDKKYISIAGGAIKRTGQYEATIRFHRDVIETLTFDVVAENQ